MWTPRDHGALVEVPPLGLVGVVDTAVYDKRWQHNEAVRGKGSENLWQGGTGPRRIVDSTLKQAKDQAEQLARALTEIPIIAPGMRGPVKL